MEMTLTYARIADRVVADEYNAVSAEIDALYKTAGTPGALPAEIETAAMTRLRREAHARMLGNGLCTRPVELECRMESACETCAYFQTGPEFVPVILRQRDHARDHHQPDRVALFEQPPRQESNTMVLDNDHPYNAGSAPPVTAADAVVLCAVAGRVTLVRFAWFTGLPGKHSEGVEWPSCPRGRSPSCSRTWRVRPACGRSTRGRCRARWRGMTRSSATRSSRMAVTS